MENAQEDVLRRKLAELELMPFAERPADLFGYEAGGGYGRRRASFGWFLIWAALEWAKLPTSYAVARAALPAGKTKNELPGKTTRRRRARSTRRTGKTRAIARKRAAKRGKKGGRK
jgi:hypothetical protein